MNEMDDFYPFASRALDVPGSGIAYMMGYAAKSEDVISLGQGTPVFPTPNFIYEYLTERARKDPSVGMYSGAKIEDELKSLIREEMAALYGFFPEMGEICLTVGGIGALFSALMVFLEKGDEVIYFDPSYPLHLSQIHLTQARPVFVSLIEDSGWAIDLPKLKSAISSKTKLVVLTNPNNPTGTVLSEAEVRELSRIVTDNNLILVVDEAYDFLVYGQKFFSPMEIPELRDRVVLCKSFSKEFAMTGWRLGYAFASGAIIKKINDVHTHFSISPPTPSIAAGIAALSDPRGKEARAGFIEEFRKSREVVCQRLGRLHELFSFQKPAGAYYVFPKILGFDLQALEFAKLLVDEAKVVTIPGTFMGPSGEGHLRMSFAAESSYINKAFDRIDDFAKTHHLL